MKPETLTDFSKLCVHTMTTKPWSIEQAIDNYAEAEIGGITVWRQWLEGHNVEKIGNQIRERDLEIVSLCRGGFFPAKTDAELNEAVEVNIQAVREAAELGTDLVVLVCGAVPGQCLDESRKQIADGIEKVLPVAEELGVRLGIEPLHPMYADDRSAINTLASANDVCDGVGHELVGVALDVYHVWWDPDLEAQIKRTAAANRLFAFHICDWMTPTTDLLNDRGLMGEGCIDIPKIRGIVESTGFSGFNEVEIFSNRWWDTDQRDFLKAIKTAYLNNS